MVINVLAGGYVMLVVILLVLTRKGQPRTRPPLASDDPSIMILFGG